VRGEEERRGGGRKEGMEWNERKVGRAKGRDKGKGE